MITIHWGKDDKTVLQYDFEDEWDIEGLIEALDAGVEVAERYPHNMDVIVNLTDAGYPNLLGMGVNKAFERAFKRTNQHMEASRKEPGIVLVVTQNTIMRNTLLALLKLYPGLGDKLAVADTVPQALAHIEQFRATRQHTALHT